MKITIDVPDQALTDLRAKAERLGVSLEDYVVRLIERDIAKHDPEAANRRHDRKFRHISEVIADIMSDAPPEAQANCSKPRH